MENSGYTLAQRCIKTRQRASTAFFQDQEWPEPAQREKGLWRNNFGKLTTYD